MDEVDRRVVDFSGRSGRGSLLTLLLGAVHKVHFVHIVHFSPQICASPQNKRTPLAAAREVQFVTMFEVLFMYLSYCNFQRYA